MKSIQRTALAVTLLLASQIAFAQTSRKVDAALDGFKNTPFMVQYLDLRTQMETTARSFRSKLNNGGEHPIDPQEAQAVISGYEKSVARANAILRGIVTDFLDPKKMKFIGKLPDSYAKGLELDLRSLNDFQTVRSGVRIRRQRCRKCSSSALLNRDALYLALSRDEWP